MQSVLSHWVGGVELLASESGHESVDPSAPDETVASVPEGGATVVDQSVTVALGAQAAWARLSGAERGIRLSAWAAVVRRDAAAWANLLVREVGKPLVEAKGEVSRCASILDYAASSAVRPNGHVIPALASRQLQYTVQRPLGVVGLITPWNFPVAIPIWKAAPALAVGNCVVLKPSERSSATAMLLATSADEAGVPAGVFSVVHGAGPTGQALTAHPDVRAISFTGSEAVGRQIAVACAGRNAKFQTEMGGKNASIVLGDAQMDVAAALIAGGAMRFAGQKCTATSRAIVLREALDSFLAALRPAIEALPVGHPSDVNTLVGPVIDAASYAKLTAVDTEVGSDAWYRGVSAAPGYGVHPLVVVGADPSSPIAQQELFGPVLAVIVADDLDHAIAIANDSRYGLSASVFTSNLGSALEFVRRIEVGMVRVNGDTTGVDAYAPFGGLKASSSGSREQGPVATDFYTETQTIQIAG